MRHDRETEFDWNDEQVDRLVRLHSEGHSFATIARDFGISRSAVIGKSYRLGLQSRDNARVWSKEETATLVRMYGAGDSFEYIAKTLAMSKGAVARRAYRIGLQPRDKRSHKPPADKGPRISGRRLQIPAPSIDDVAIPLEQRKTLLQLETHHCRFPVGDPDKPGFFFCGGIAEQGHPYCAGHLARAWERRKKQPGGFVLRDTAKPSMPKIYATA